MPAKQDSDHGRPTFWQVLCFRSGTEVDQANNKQFTLWCIAWALAIVGATSLITFLEDLPKSLAWLIALAPNALALLALLSYLRLLRMTDELQRKIHIEGLAMGFGAGWMFALGYMALESVGAPQMSLTGMIMVLTAGWMVGTFMAVRRYL